MPPKVAAKTPQKGKGQPKINTFTRKLRSKHNSAPGSFMPVIEEEEFESVEEMLSEDASLKDIIDKLNEMGKRMECIEFALYNEDTGIKGRIAEQELKAETAHGKALFMAKEYRSVKQDMSVVKGLIQRHARQIETIDHKLVDITARSMAMNMVISGIIEAKDENCKYQVKKFLKEEMDLDLDMCPEFKIKVAHRLGSKTVLKQKRKGSRPMVVKVNQSLKDAMLENTARLDGRTNLQGDEYYVNVQQPEARVEARRNAKAILRKYQAKLPTAKVEIRGEKVYVNSQWKRPLVHAPTPQDLYHDPDEQKEMNKMKIIYTQPEDISASSFWASAVRVSTVSEVQRAYNKI